MKEQLNAETLVDRALSIGIRTDVARRVLLLGAHIQEKPVELHGYVLELRPHERRNRVVLCQSPANRMLNAGSIGRNGLYTLLDPPGHSYYKREDGVITQIVLPPDHYQHLPFLDVTLHITGIKQL